MSNLASTLNLVRKEVDGALDQAAVQLEHYAESGNADDLKGFLGEIQQVRGTFKMLDIHEIWSSHILFTHNVRCKVVKFRPVNV